LERSCPSLSLVIKTVSAMVAGMVLLRRTPEANEYGVLLAMVPAPLAAGKVESEPKTVLASSLSWRHFPKRVVVKSVEGLVEPFMWMETRTLAPVVLA
jgi:cation transporter-like permease